MIGQLISVQLLSLVVLLGFLAAIAPRSAAAAELKLLFLGDNGHHRPADRFRQIGYPEILGTVYWFFGSTLRAKGALHTKLMDHLIGPRLVTIGTTSLNAPADGSQLSFRLRSVHLVEPSRAAGKRPGGQ